MSLLDTASKPGEDLFPDDIEKQQAIFSVATPDSPSLEAPRKQEKPRFGASLISRLAVQDGETYSVDYEKHPRWYQRLLQAGVEDNGIKPVPVEHRTVTQYSNLFTIFFTCLLNLLP